MKTILIAVDFSDQSINAVNYAAELAVHSNSKLIILHVYDSTPMVLEGPIVMPVAGAKEMITLELNKIVQTIEHKFGSNLVEKVLVETGLVVEEINLAAEENNVDLVVMVVMGVKGVGYLTERLVGSTTTSLIRKSKKPVLVVSKQMKFKKLKKLLFATDGNRIEEENTFLPLKQLLKIFEAHLYVVHVVSEEVLTDAYNDLDAFKFDEEWLSHSLSFHHIIGNDTTEGLNDFIHNHNIDLMVMVPHKHDFFERVLHEPQTQKMVFHAAAPVLTLPE
jgi:nucleotide-binding universal stress UspA family protein